jgi:regulator of RNase E activity RraA
MKQESPNEAEAIEMLAQCSVPIVSDALGKCLFRPLKHQTMDAGIKPLCPSMTMCGPAYTVTVYPGATWAMELAVAEAPPDNVIVANGQGSDAGVLMGSLMGTFAKRRGILGAVVDGAVRDIEDLIEIDFPTFSRHVVARSGTSAQLGSRQVSITCGGVIVKPGDIVLGDQNGVTVVPSEILVPAAKASLSLKRWEEEIKALLLAGLTLEEAVSKAEKPPMFQV